jgi:hypothetical protein
MRPAGRTGPTRLALPNGPRAGRLVTSLVGMARERAEASNLGTTTIGFGEDFDEDPLTAMADTGRGNAHCAPTPDAAPAIFASEFEGLMSLVAQNVSIEFRMSEDVALIGLLNEFPTVAVPEASRSRSATPTGTSGDESYSSSTSPGWRRSVHGGSQRSCSGT